MSYKRDKNYCLFEIHDDIISLVTPRKKQLLISLPHLLVIRHISTYSKLNEYTPVDIR